MMILGTVLLYYRTLPLPTTVYLPLAVVDHAVAARAAEHDVACGQLLTHTLVHVL